MKTGAVAILAALLLAGCQAPHGSGNATSTSPAPFVPEPKPTVVNGCVKYVCLADPSTHDAQYAIREYGLHQINADSGQEFQPAVEGDFLIWEQGHSVNGELVDGIFGFNLTTGDLVPIAWENYYLQVRPYLKDGRAVYGREARTGSPETNGYTHLMLWEKRTSERTRLETGMPGDSVPFGFDGTWVAFRNRFSSNESENGLFGLNVESGEVIPVYHPKTREFGEKLVAEAVSQGRLYYEVDVDRVGGGFDANLHEYDLANKTDQVVAVIPGKSAGRMVASERYIVWEGIWGSVASTIIYAYDRVTGQVLEITDIGEGGTFPSVGGEWVTFKHHQFGVSSAVDEIIAHHIPTGDRVVVVPEDTEGSASSSATDGRRVIVVFSRHHADFQTFGTDVYWTVLPGG